MPDPISVIVPARNEAQTIARVVRVLRDMAGVAEVVVIDNGSTDATAAEAADAGAQVVTQTRPGMGHAVRTGIGAARHDWVMKVDADLDKFDTALFSRMAEARAPGVGLIKGAWNDPRDNMPMTRLLVRPALARMFPGLGHLRAPNTGIYLFDKSRIAHRELVGDYAVDLDVMLRVHAAGAEVAEVDIGRIVHDARDVSHYNGMAEQIMAFFLSRQPLDLLGEVVVVAARPEAVIRTALGHAARKLMSGARVTFALDKGADVTVLSEAVAPYPTARIVRLVDLPGVALTAHAARLTVIAEEGAALTAARSLAARHAMALPVALWRMPGQGARLGDLSVDIAEGATVKRAALERLDRSAQVAPREVFRVEEDVAQ
ncbi:glucosyl-3-phosphoglycerate synthase [Roseovarius sp. A-2]|uniref:glycosyltransferase n=1 Tax=Roseovarius sp. A-2 TaxID=1570360 RepID=UPI0009B516AC|nr:glycosyltransferase [Roseovarius sp. A-2]GAW33297.1 glucosyl-3-phosphoglycerate synthase [Roseovarius sp. A-2]